MSLLGESLYQGKKSPVPGLTKVRFGLMSMTGTPSGLSLLGYTGAKIVAVTTQNSIVIDFPTTFNNLHDQVNNPQAQSGTAAMLLYELANFIVFPPNLATNLGKVVWFSAFSDVVPPVDPQWSRIWFTCVKDDGTTFLPNQANIVCELGISNTSVKPVRV